MKKNIPALFVSAILSAFLLQSCSSDSPEDMVDNNPPGNEQNEDPGDSDPPPNDGAAFEGFDLNFTTGDYWEFFWTTEEINTAQGNVSANTENGRFRITLAESLTIGGVQAFAIDITGTNLETYGGPRWSYLAARGNRLLGSVDGVSLDTIFNPQDGSWTGGGFFANFDDEATIGAFDGELENEFVATDAIAAAYQDGQSICEIIAGVRICANDDSFTLLVDEYYKPGIGPLGYNLFRSVFDQGGGFVTTSEFRFEIGLTSTSFRASDGFVPTLPPWVEKTTLPEPFVATTVVSWDDKIYIFGGLRGDGSSSRQIYAYDPESDTWSQEGQAPLDLAFQFVDGAVTQSLAYEAFVLNDKIYFARTEGPPSDAIVIFDPLANTWETGPSLNADVYGFPNYIINMDNFLLFFPIRANRLGEVRVLDTNDGLWYAGNTSPFVHLSRSTVSAIGTKVYFSGTFRAGAFENRVRVFDLSVPFGEDGAWSDMFFTGDGRADAKSEVVNGRLYVMGGDNFGPEKRSVEEYDSSSDTWKTVGSMLNARSRFLTVSVIDKIYAIDLGDSGDEVIEEYDPRRDRRSQ